MGGGFTVGMGISKALALTGQTDKKVFGVVGDSTFFHSGMTGAAEIIYNKGNMVPVVLDNSITGMTGHQDNPGSGKNLQGEIAVALRIEKILASMGYENIIIVDPQDLKATEAAIKEELAADEPSVIVVRRPCALLKWVKHKPAFHIDADKCRSCKACMQIGCPAIVFDGKAAIDPTLCVGCGLCQQLCRFGAICE
jgi:indolepyruvate ferredoxin oxidoreductase alpha subunit